MGGAWGALLGQTVLDKLDPDALRRREPPELSGRIGRVDIVDDAQTMAMVGDGSFDFVIAAHVIEHLRNPIGGVRQWLRVLKPSGRLYLVVPDKRRTFDRPRMRTTLEHLIVDDRQPSAERDFEHFLDYAIHVHKSWLDPAIAEARFSSRGFNGRDERWSGEDRRGRGLRPGMAALVRGASRARVAGGG